MKLLNCKSQKEIMVEENMNCDARAYLVVSGIFMLRVRSEKSMFLIIYSRRLEAHKMKLRDTYM